MSVKSKVKRCNAEIKHLKEQLETSELLNHKLQQQFETLIDMARKYAFLPRPFLI